MKASALLGFGGCFAVILAGTGRPQTATLPTPLIHAHAHNDYKHRRPLLDALEHGFCSVEADVHLVDGRLLVAHDLKSVKPEHTLQSLYLDPLRARVKQNGGRVFPDGPECTLLIDLKTPWTNSWPVLQRVLEKYADVLTAFRGGKKQTNAITVIVTGSRAKGMFAGEGVRYAGCDGTLADLDSAAPATLIPWVSAEWKKNFTWSGEGPMPGAERMKLGEFVTKAHAHGRRLRFWGAPDDAIFWQAMLAAGVDLINTDDLDGLAGFLNGRN